MPTEPTPTPQPAPPAEPKMPPGEWPDDSDVPF